MTFEPHDFQTKDLATLRDNNYTGLLAIQPGGGKGHPMDERVLTPTGWVTVGELTPGDQVVGSDGKPTTVTDVYDRGVLPVYLVTFRDGSSVRTDGDHLWRVRRTSNGGKEYFETKSTRHLARLASKQTYEVPTTSVEHPERELPIEPYALGALLADGSLVRKQIMWTKNNQKVVGEMRKSVASSGGELRDRPVGEQWAKRYEVRGLNSQIETLGMRVKSASKRIPRKYLVTSVGQRTRLIHGLFDGDGSVRKDRGTADYSTTSPGLAKDVQQLLWSLGVGATLRLKKHRRGNYWIVTVHGNYNPFLHDENKHLVKGTTRTLRRSFKSIEPVGEMPVRCIRVAAEDHLYVTKDYIVTHNTYLSLFAARESNASQTLVIAPKSTFASAWQKSTPNVLEHEARVIGNGTKAERQALSDLEWGEPGVFLVSPQLFTRADISMWKPDLLVCDEVHQINKAGGKGQRKLSGMSPKDAPISKQVGASLSLSGTPARSSFERLWAICRLHWPELYRRGEVGYDNYYSWLLDRMTSKEIITGKKNPETGKFPTAKVWLAERDEGRLFQEMPCVIQHFRREECCEFHPEGFLLNEEPNVVKREVELTTKQKRIIKELEKQGLAWIDDQAFVVDLPMTIKQRIRQVTLGEPEIKFTGEYDEYGVEKTTLQYVPECKSPAIDELFNILGQLGDEPVIVYMASQQFAEVVTKRLNDAGISAFEYSGQTHKTRDSDLAQFGTKYRVCVGIVSAIGTGTDNLQDVCNNEVWMEVPLDDVDTQQTMARLDRMGQTKQVQQFWIHDELGYSQGMYDTKLTKRLELARSTRLEV